VRQEHIAALRVYYFYRITSIPQAVQPVGKLWITTTMVCVVLIVVSTNSRLIAVLVSTRVNVRTTSFLAPLPKCLRL